MNPQLRYFVNYVYEGMFFNSECSSSLRAFMLLQRQLMVHEFISFTLKGTLSQCYWPLDQ